ncbi:hypothetical protein [Neobacillus dielmonensis]|uniref:hypothetical protein n=1 Tax=Neobacillus dielmonensis TaxID=1347369 RepID=UPI000B08B68C|nr:hypothetical protein [Neobacillus dielmonensis]
MVKNENQQDLLVQPLMSTGTTEAGFDAQDHNSQTQASKPKIGEVIVGERNED